MYKRQGTLSAGLAHELNNPAAAVKRSVQNLEDILQKLPTLALKLHQQPLTRERLAFLSDLYQQATTTAKSCSHLDPLTRSEAEDEVSDWLEAHDVDEGWKLAPTLVASGLDTDRLDEVLTNVSSECLGDVLAWLEATLTGVGLMGEIKLSTGRISELIKAMKEYSYMDRAPLQEVDVHEGIESTLTIPVSYTHLTLPTIYSV